MTPDELQTMLSANGKSRRHTRPPRGQKIYSDSSLAGASDSINITR